MESLHHHSVWNSMSENWEMEWFITPTINYHQYNANHMLILSLLCRYKFFISAY
jgi:hypothetical protein